MGRQEDFLRHFLKHQDDLRAFIGSLVRDRHACEDVLQDVALVLWQKFADYDPARPFGAWARGIAANKIMQLFEKSKRLPLPLSPDATQIIAMVFEDGRASPSAEQEVLRGCIDKLPERARALVRMRYEESLKLKEIAERVSSSLDAVHKTLSRTRELLRECVEARLVMTGEASHG